MQYRADINALDLNFRIRRSRSQWNKICWNTALLWMLTLWLALDGSDAGVCVNGSTMLNLRFADDISLLANSDMDLQQLVNKVDVASRRFGLTISSSKTEVQVVGRDVSQVATSNAYQARQWRAKPS